MTDQDSYRPRSPDFSSLHSPFPQQPLDNSYSLASPLAHRASYDASPFFAPQQHRPSAPSRVPQQYVPPLTDPSDPEMARRSTRLAHAPEAPSMAEPEDIPEDIEPSLDEPVKPTPTSGVEVRTKFPVARIKRIMQADEDVGKVAQVTPIAVSKALELFMISLVTKASEEAKDRNSRRVTASHLKQAVAKDEVLDFLADIIAKVPDNAPGRKHDDDGSDHNEGRRKRGGRRPKDESE